MAASDVSIANSALAKLGGDRISALTDSSREAVLLNEQYEKVRDDLLRAHPWNFATKRATLATTTTPDEAKFDNTFLLPTDLIRILETDAQDMEWQREGATLVTDASTVDIRYTAKITDPGLFDDNFSEVLACKLAADICYALTQNATFRAQLMAEYTQRLREARSFNAQEGGTRQVYARDWVNARY